MIDELEKVNIHGYVDKRLRAVIEEIADREDIALSECVAQLLAKAVDRMDLAEVPRKRMGRPRGKVTPTNGKPAKKGKSNAQ